MVLEDQVKTIYTCEICGRIWINKNHAEFCEKQCLKGEPIKISKVEHMGRVRAYKKMHNLTDEDIFIQQLEKVSKEKDLDEEQTKIFIAFMLRYDYCGHINYSREVADRLFIEKNEYSPFDQKWVDVLNEVGYDTSQWKMFGDD